MAAIGVFSDSDGDLALFDAALAFLVSKGARRFLFAGGRYEDLDNWAKWKRDAARAANDYTNADFLFDVKQWLIGLEQVERPAAFGESYELSREAEELAQLKGRVVRTPEKGGLPYQDSSVPRKTVDMLGEVLCCVVHDKNDLDKEDMINAAVLVHGNAPEGKVVQIGPRYFVTPGKLKGGKAPTVGLFELTDKGITYSVFGLDGSTALAPQMLAMGAKTKVTVK